MGIRSRGLALDWSADQPPPRRWRITCPCGHDATTTAVEWDSAMHEVFCPNPDITTEEIEA